MKNTKENTCPEEWMIQAFVDGELVGDELVDIRNHINTCAVCQSRVEKRRITIQSIFKLMDSPVNMPVSNTRILFSAKLRWYSAAASVIIIMGFSIWFLNLKYGFGRNGFDCKWVELNQKDLNSQFESPNRLYNKRVIEFKEVDMDGNSTSTFLVKQCDN